MKHMSYEEAIKAKSSIESLDFGDAFEDDVILELVSNLSLNEKAAIAAGSFNRSYGSYGGLQFMMPSTKDVLQFDLEDLENSSVSNGVQFTVSESQNNATDYGFYSIESVRTIRTGRFK